MAINIIGKTSRVSVFLSNNRSVALIIAAILSVLVSWIAVELAEFKLRQERRDMLRYETRRYALDIMYQTAKSNVMGGIILLGIASDPLKNAALNDLKKDYRDVISILSATAMGVKSDNTFIVGQNGIIVIDSPKGVKSAVGLNVAFRPYFKQAMKNIPNVYAAVALSTGERGLYITAPIHRTKDPESEPIGAISVRLSMEPTEALLKTWKGTALLISPQGVVFASNKTDLVYKVIQGLTEEDYRAIKKEKQFGAFFEKSGFQSLPFSIDSGSILIEGVTYALEKESLKWNDPIGDWTLVLMENHSNLLSVKMRWIIALTSGLCALISILIILYWNKRFNLVAKEREQAQLEIMKRAAELESLSEVRLNISEITKDLQRASTFGELSQKVMSSIVPLLKADCGLFYIYDSETGLYRQSGSYGYCGNGSNFAVGQGLVGQCALQKEPIVIRDTEGAGILINWGMGEVKPRELLFQPVIQRDSVLGVIEIAGMSSFVEESHEILEEILPTIAMNIEILDRNIRTESLLAATQQQAKTLSLQQEQLQEASLKREEALHALEQQIDELAQARQAMFNIMEDLEVARKEAEERNKQTEHLLKETQKQAEKLKSQQDEMRDTEMWYRGIIESAPDGMLVVDEEGMIIHLNPMAEKIFGYNSGELLGESVDMLVPISVRERHPSLRQRFMQDMNVRSFGTGLNLKGTRKDGTEVPLEIGLAKLPAIGSRGRCVCISVRDITERKQLEESIRQQMDELERFNSLTINREEKMIQLKEEVNTLLMQMGKDKKYKIVQ